MGEVDLHFKPSVPVFDACVALGRRHDRLVREDSVAGTIDVMDKAGVGRALVYSPHAVAFDAKEGNQLLMDMIRGEARLVPQFAVNPTFDDLDAFTAELHELNVRSIRISPELHRYPFRDWIVKPWLDRMAAERIPIWIAATDFDPVDLHDTLKEHPDVSIVLSEVHYIHVPWLYSLLRSLPNVRVEISRFVIAGGVAKLMDTVDSSRILFGSRFPDSPMAPQLYSLHRNGLSDADLAAICAGNLERLLEKE